MKEIKLKLFYLMIFLVFTQGMWERIFLFSTTIQYVVEGSILAYIIFQFNYNLKTPGSSIFLLFCIVTFLIGFINNDSIFSSFLYIRYTLYTYLIYNQLYSYSFSLKNWNYIFKLLITMTLLQGIGAIFNIFILNERIEGYVGLMSSLGGTTATIFPLFISTLLLVFYLFSPKINKKTTFLLLLILLSVLLVGYSSGKRGIYFIIPLIFLIVIIITIPKILRTRSFKKKLIGITVFGILVFPLIIFGMINSRGLNYSLSGNESSFDIISNSIDYAGEYESSTDQYGRTIGRSNTSNRILENTLSDPSLFFSGIGYGATKEESSMLRLGYGYGIVGFTRDLISGGFFLTLLTILLFVQIIINNKSIHTKFSKTTRQSMLIVFIYTHFFYSSDYTVSLKITLILIVLMALLNSPVHHKTLMELLKRNKI